jgi:hypothetical protein
VEDEVDEGLEEEDAMAFGRCREGMKGEGGLVWRLFGF